MSITNSINARVIGHVKIQDRNSGELLLDKENAIHPKNMGIAIARGLANNTNGCVYKVWLGNGGTFQSGTGEITYLPPNIVGTGPAPTGSSLYNSTYSSVIDDQSTLVGIGNSVIHPAEEDLNAAIFSTAVITIVIAAGGIGLDGQALSDSPNPQTDPNFNPTLDPIPAGVTPKEFVFDELGLFTSDDFLLSHLIFSPIEKTANRELLITYTLTIYVAGI